MKRLLISLCFFISTAGIVVADGPSDTRGILNDLSHEIQDIEHAVESGTTRVAKEVITDVKACAHKAFAAVEGAEGKAASLIKEYITSVTTRLAIEKAGAHSSLKAEVADQPTENLANRKAKAQHAVSEFLATEITSDELPTIAFCGSGGGVRAMYETLGWLSAADELGLLDTIQYVSGLSGSTWALNPWVASKKSIDDYSQQVVPRLTSSLVDQIKAMTTEDIYDLTIALGQKYYNKQEVGVIDLYGCLLTHVFLKGIAKDPYQVTLSSLQPQIDSGDYPQVLSTSILGANTTLNNAYTYKPTFEFSPSTSGSFELNCFIPTWSVGRTFLHGATEVLEPRSLFPELGPLESAAKKIAPGYYERVKEIYDAIELIEHTTYYGQEVPLGYLMGICGSAFSADVYNILLELYQLMYPGPIAPSKQAPLEHVLSFLQTVLEQELGALGEKLSKGKVSASEITTYLKNHEIASAQLANPTYSLSTPLKALKEVTLVDGGYQLMNLDRLNIGITPLLHRDVDLIFICDSSEDLKGAPSLRATEKLAQILSLPFPKVSYDTIDTAYASLLVDEGNPQAPIVVYMPGIANTEYSKLVGRTVNPQADNYLAQNFQYTSDQAEDLMGVISYNVMQSKDIIRQAVELAHKKKKATS